LQAIGDRVPLGYAFAVGMAAAVNPCGFALLPAYLGLYLGTATAAKQRPSHAPSVVRRAASFVGLFGALGLVLSFASAAVGAALPWLSLAVGVALLLTGGFMLGGGRLSLSGADRAAGRLGGAATNTGLMGYAVYGLAFALSSLGCTLPLFLAVMGSALAAGGPFGGLEEFVLYALGMGAVVTILTLSIGLFGHALVGHIRRVGRFVEPVGAVLVLLTGAYVVYGELADLDASMLNAVPGYKGQVHAREQARQPPVD
jgi:cytochrome c biogenesis protein CcdA